MCGFASIPTSRPNLESVSYEISLSQRAIQRHLARLSRLQQFSSCLFLG